MAMDPSTADATRVIARWTASYDPALRVVAGEKVLPKRRDPDNPGWVWCVNARGLGGWLPEPLVEDGRASVDFDTMELTVSEGDQVVVLETLAGWSRCLGQGGETGWPPDSCLEAPVHAGA